MLKVHQIYLKSFLLLFFILFFIIAIEGYFCKNFDQFFTTLFVTFIVFTIILYISISKITASLEKEVFKIINFLKHLTKKNKIESIESDFSQEFQKITKLLRNISKTLIRQDIQKRAYTEKLEFANNQKDEIISAISHEFKNPIAVINGYTQTLLNDDNLPKSLRKKFLSKIYKNGEKLTHLIDTLRLAIKLDENSQKFYFTEVNICELTNEIIEDIKDSYDRSIKLFCNNTFIKVDEVLFGIAIRNLIENGIKYSEDEVIIIIENSCIKIIDKGIGITQNDIEKITDKFYRVNNNTWNNSLGLGLSIVKNIVELHNFDLKINSEINKGSEFIIKFYKQ